MSEETLDHGSSEHIELLPLKQRWYLLLAGVVIYTVMGLGGIFNSIKLQSLIDRYNNGDNGAAIELAAMDKEGATPLSILLAGIGICCIVFVCMWIYRASQNVHQSGVNYLNYQPGWLVGWFFIPVAHIFMPAIAMKEMVKGCLSIPNKEEHSAWQNNKLPFSYYLWAIPFTLKLLLAYGMVFYGISLAKELASFNAEARIQLYQSTVYVSYAATILLVAEATGLYLLSKQITQIQESHSNQN